MPQDSTTVVRVQRIAINYWPILVALSALYIPTIITLSNGLWATEKQSHGPIILGIVTWLAYRNWSKMLRESENASPTAWGWVIMFIGLLFYFVGRSQDISLLEVSSALFILSSLILLTLGPKALKSQWFPLFFMLFLIPLPSVVVDALTLPMKTAVSIVTEEILYWFDYPISRTGVTLQIGKYQLLVADACAGLHTLFTLEAMGLLYLNVVERDSTFRNLTLAMLIIPISFTANVIRVITLTLITYYLGNEAGQGFLHGFAGMLLFVVALMLIFSTDNLIQWVEESRMNKKANKAGLA